MNRICNLLAFIVFVLCFAGCERGSDNDILQRAEAAAAAGQWQHAQILAERAARNPTLKVQATILVGIAQHYQDDKISALETIEKAVSFNPDSFAANYFHGWMLCENQQWADALPPLRRALQLTPGDPNVLVMLAKCSLEQNLIQGTSYLQALRKVEEMRNSPALYNAIAVLWVGRPDYDMAKRYLLQALERDSSNLVVLQNLAVLHDTYLNDEDNALKYYRLCLRASQLANDNVRVQRIIERLRQLARQRSSSTSAAGSL